MIRHLRPLVALALIAFILAVWLLDRELKRAQADCRRQADDLGLLAEWSPDRGCVLAKHAERLATGGRPHD